MKRAFISVKWLIAIIVAAAFAAIAVPKALKPSSAENDRQDLVHVRAAQKLAKMAFDRKKSHSETEVFYYDAKNSKILDAADPGDHDKLSGVVGYGASYLNDSFGTRSGAKGVPKDHILRIEMNQRGDITSITWEKEAVPYTGER